MSYTSFYSWGGVFGAIAIGVTIKLIRRFIRSRGSDGDDDEEKSKLLKIKSSLLKLKGEFVQYLKNK